MTNRKIEALVMGRNWITSAGDIVTGWDLAGLLTDLEGDGFTVERFPTTAPGLVAVIASQAGEVDREYYGRK